MTGRGHRMSPEERYLRSVYLNYQVCTDVVRHYFDGLPPPKSLVRYLLDQRTKFEKEEKKIPNYQWIQLYPEDRINTIFTCLFDSVDGDQKVKVVNLSRLESGEVLATLEITSQYNPDGRIIKQALEATVKSGHVDASLETSPDGFSFAKQGVSDSYLMEINITKVNAAALARKDTKEFGIMAKKLERILLLLFDTVPGTQSVEVEEFRNLTSDCATAIFVFEAQIKVKENFSTKFENSNSNEFKAFTNRVQPIIKELYDSVTGDQDVEIEKCR
ncbi:unnamed protein product [Mytilus coruscus]|uniref:SEA domain-containing protein n=1 Tax=Mytilus coruscus TaxID=42192 RepID=A0A6J8BB81_MYTCO|nr:unnamed protein product [Mytilus coruscus]